MTDHFHYSNSIHSQTGRDQSWLLVSTRFYMRLNDSVCSWLTLRRGYTTAHAIDVLPKFFPAPEVASVRLMVTYGYSPGCLEFLANCIQTIFFGANDACVLGHPQHVPIEKYKENLKFLIQHPAVRAQNPRIVLITPPPINEYQLEDFDISKNNPHPTRTAALAKAYGEALKEVGASLNVAVADIWTSFMSSVGWKEGEPLIGSRDVPQNAEFAALFTDGMFSFPSLASIMRMGH